MGDGIAQSPIDKMRSQSIDVEHLLTSINVRLSQVKGAAPAAAPATVVPQNFAAGQQIAGNPLAPLLNAQNAGALGEFSYLSKKLE